MSFRFHNWGVPFQLALDMNEGFGRSVAAGALHGAAAWSAYALLEFLFASVLFRLARPHAVFSAWHWKLTAMLFLGYLIAGPVCGALAGAAAWMLRRRMQLSVEAAASFTLVLAFGLHLALNAEAGRFWLLAAAGVFGALLLIPQLRDKAGWLTNYWIVSGLLLGLGQVLGLQEMGVASQLGARLGVASKVLDGASGGRSRGFGSARKEVPASGRAAANGSDRRGRRADGDQLRPGTAGSAGGGSCFTGPGRFRPSEHPADCDGHGARRPSGGVRLRTRHHAEPARSGPRFDGVHGGDVGLGYHADFSRIVVHGHVSELARRVLRSAKRGIRAGALRARTPRLRNCCSKGGYQTTGVAANLYLRADFGLERGFDRFHIPRPVPVLAAENGFMLRHGMRRGLSLVFDTAQFDRLYAMGEDINTALFADLSSPSKSGAPVFTFVNYMDAHFPYLPPAPYDARYPGRRPGMTQDDLEEEQKALVTGQSGAGDYRPHCVSQYDGGIAYEDQQIGDVVTWLKRRGAYDNTMIVVTSDHGEAFGERNRVGHANSPYQNLLHVALMVKYPHQARRGTEDRPVSLTDVAPTILEAAGIAAPQAMQGRSLTAVDGP